jgi:hypothetical protein
MHATSRRAWPLAPPCQGAATTILSLTYLLGSELVIWSETRHGQADSARGRAPPEIWFVWAVREKALLNHFMPKVRDPCSYYPPSFHLPDPNA